MKREKKKQMTGSKTERHLEGEKNTRKTNSGGWTGAAMNIKLSRDITKIAFNTETMKEKTCH